MKRKGRMKHLWCVPAIAAFLFLTGHNVSAQEQKWSVYAQGGLSWANGVAYQNLDARRGIGLSPALGGGVDFTIRPWVRVGAEYLWTTYSREQRFATPDWNNMPVQVYGNYLMNVHSAHIGAGFNLMELWRERQFRWLNLWAGTGIGYMLGSTNTYGIWFNSTVTQGGVTTPITGDITLDNGSSLSVTGQVRTTNTPTSFKAIYIPLSLHLEADVNRQLSLGLKAEMNWLPERAQAQPKSLIHALVTLRYNFVPSSSKVLKKYYAGEVAALNDRILDLSRKADQEMKNAAEARKQQKLLQEENERLQELLSECEGRPMQYGGPSRVSHIVHFDNNSSYFNEEEAIMLREFARRYKGYRIAIVAEASTPGTREYNQELSERRLARVIELLVSEGFALENLKPSFAIGEQNGIETAEGRIVTLSVEE